MKTMRHKIDIYKKNKISGIRLFENQVTLTEDDINKAALDKYVNDYAIDGEWEYYARIIQTVI